MLEPGEQSGVARVAASETADQQRRVVLLRDILQASMREECQDPRFAGYLQIFGGGDDFNGVDRLTGEAIHRLKTCSGPTRSSSSTGGTTTTRTRLAAAWGTLPQAPRMP